MKKALILAASILAASCAFCATGCNDKGDKIDCVNYGAVYESDCGGTCGESAMPKVRYEFKDGRPV